MVLYICLCGFPPFSDELYTRENPYNLAQQIKMGRFDYPSPYWDSVGDPALDLIDRMLTVDVGQRITIDECLEHPWVTQRDLVNPADSTDGLTSAIGQLDFSKRKVHRERTLLSSINDVKVDKVIQVHGHQVTGQPDKPNDPAQVKVWEKNPSGKKIRLSPGKSGQAPNKGKGKGKAGPKEETPAAARAPEEFMQMGGNGDQRLFGDDASSRYAPEEVPRTNGV